MRMEAAAKIVHRLGGVLQVGGVPYSAARVDVFGQSRGRAAVRSYRVVDRQGRITGVPAAIGAAWLASGRLQARGAFAPEGCLEPDPFFAELGRRRILVEQITPS